MTSVALKPGQLQLVDGYLWIPTAALRVPGFAKVDLFTCGLGELEPRKWHAAKQSLSAESILELERQESTKVLVRKADFRSVSDSVLAQLEKIVVDNRLTVPERFALLQIALVYPVEHSFRKPYSTQFVEVAQQAGRQIAKLLQDSPVLASDVYEMSLRDDSTAVHLTNVAACAVLLAQQLGILEPDQLTKIAIGAILHEFGKLFLPADLLNKTGRLSVQEREQLERAPQLGYEKLCDRDDLEFGQLMMVYQQHERFDGSGYPVGVESDEIHLWARILSVADTFDTMISKKTYRRENRVAAALLYLADNASLHFDPKAVLCWMNIFPQQ